MVNPVFAVASSNPVKLDAVRLGAGRLFEGVTVLAVSGDSNVSEQPFGDDETQRGAIARATGALRTCPQADFGAGLEGGVLDAPDGLYCIAWCAVISAAGELGLASAGNFLLPPKVAELVRQGVELGHADDIVFGRQNSKHKDGAIGVLTGGRVTRTEYYAPMVTRALLRFINPALYSFVNPATRSARARRDPSV
jgi:inosine/xanthosine triphosphatase